MFRSMSRVLAVPVIAFSLFLVTAPVAQAKPDKPVKRRAAQQETLLQQAMAWLSRIVLSSEISAIKPAPGGTEPIQGGPCIDPLGRPCDDIQP